MVCFVNALRNVQESGHAAQELQFPKSAKCNFPCVCIWSVPERVRLVDCVQRLLQIVRMCSLENRHLSSHYHQEPCTPIIYRVDQSVLAKL